MKQGLLGVEKQNKTCMEDLGEGRQPGLGSGGGKKRGCQSAAGLEAASDLGWSDLCGV